MKGILYKDFKVLLKQIKPTFILLIVVAIGFVIYKVPPFGGVIASMMVGLTVGMIPIYFIQSDEQANWKKYELTLPVTKFSLIGSKYLVQIMAAVFTVLFSVIVLSLEHIILKDVSLVLVKTSLILSFVSPILIGSFMIPLSLKFGTQKARFMAMPLFLPIVFIISGFEDGNITANILNDYNSFLLIFIVVSLIVLLASYFVSIFLYKDRLS